MGKITTIGIDVAKHVFQIAAADRRGVDQPVEQPRILSRSGFVKYLDSLPTGLVVGMETGPGVQVWARRLRARRIDVRVLPAQRVAEHRSGAKNDAQDARAIVRALHDSSIQPVPIKTVEELTLQALHRARAGWRSRKTALGNQMRGLLLEHDVTIAQGDEALRRALREVAGNTAVPEMLRVLIERMAIDWGLQQQHIEAIDVLLKAEVRANPLARRLDAVPGIGTITATALVAKGLDASRYRNARMFAASFGIVPEQHSSGARIRLGAMSKRGDCYIRSLLIEGAMAKVRATQQDRFDPLSRRICRWRDRHGTKGAAVRLANHNLRVVWAMLHRNADYQRSQAMSKR